MTDLRKLQISQFLLQRKSDTESTSRQLAHQIGVSETVIENIVKLKWEAQPNLVSDSMFQSDASAVT